MIATVQQLLVDAGFLGGLAASGTFILILRMTGRDLPLLTLPVLGSLAALVGVGLLRPALALGVGITFLPSRWIPSLRVRSAVTAVAILITLAAPDTADEPLLIALVILGAIGLQRPLALHDKPKTMAVLAFLSIAGIWATIPDTDAVRTLVGAALGTVTLSFVFAGSMIVTSSGLMRLGVLMGSLALAGGDNRAGSIVGSVGALGMLLVGEDLRLGRFSFRVRSDWHLIAMHLVLVLVWSRVAGFRTSTLASMGVGLPLTVLVLFIGMRRTDSRHEGTREDS